MKVGGGPGVSRKRTFGLERSPCVDHGDRTRTREGWGHVRGIYKQSVPKRGTSAGLSSYPDLELGWKMDMSRSTHCWVISACNVPCGALFCAIAHYLGTLVRTMCPVVHYFVQ